MTADTHYIASTGIEGQSEDSSQIVKMDSLGIFGIVPAQMEFMTAPGYMSPTQIYGVTFERGTRLIFGNASLYFISGTASIDKSGRIVHLGNVMAQAKRMIENVEALLKNHGGTWDDLKQAAVYLRDIADYPRIFDFLQEKIGQICPFLVVEGTVCRPGWLIEMECIAANHKGKNIFPVL